MPMCFSFAFSQKLGFHKALQGYKLNAYRITEKLDSVVIYSRKDLTQFCKRGKESNRI